MGSGRDGIGALRHHPGAGDVSHNLGAGQVSADAGLGALAHFDLDGSTGVEVVLVDAEAAGGHLHHRIGTVPVEVLMQAAFPAVVADSQFLGGLGQGGVGIVADGTVAHGGEQNRHAQLQLRRQAAVQMALGIPPDLTGLLAQKDPGLHGFPEWVDGGVGNL